MTALDLPALNALRTLIDEAIEVALVDHQSLPELMGRVLPQVREKLGAELLIFETYGEDRALQEFVSPEGRVLPERDAVFTRTSDSRRESFVLETADATIIAQPIDVAGAWFGRAALVLPQGAPSEQAREGLLVLAEVLDNHLFAIRAAREKHTVMMRVGNALRHRVLGEGLANAVEILGEMVPLDRLVLVYTAEQGAAKKIGRAHV